jgi:hypothetical protein
MKAILAIVGVVVLAVVGFLGWQYYRIQQAVNGPAREIVSESITRSGDTWHLSFVSKFDAPVDKVYQAFSDPENSHERVQENFLKSELVRAEGNTKLVDIVTRTDILPPGFKVQNVRLEYIFFPAEHRWTSRSIDFKLADLNSTYRLEPTPDGKGTLLRFDQTSKDKAPMLLESLQKGALREAYLTQVKSANRQLGLAPAAGADQKQAG